MQSSDKLGGAHHPPVHNVSDQHVLDSKTNQTVGIRIERGENATWTLKDRQDLRIRLFKTLGIKQVGISAHSPECIASISPETVMNIDGKVIEGIGTLHVDASVARTDEWRDATLNVTEKEYATSVSSAENASPENLEIDVVETGEQGVVQAA